MKKPYKISVKQVRLCCTLVSHVFPLFVVIGPERLAEAFSYVEKHQLYNTALSIWKGTGNYNACAISTLHNNLI
jgi:hypothetical protein